MKLNFRLVAALCAAAVLAQAHTPSALAAESQKDKERRLISVLRSSAPKSEKAITCKRLVTCATKESVPVLADLLPDPELSSWARTTLEAIPDPAADYALRGAMDKLQGRLLTGVINSIGFRRDVNSAFALADKLKDPDADVASAAAEALGKIAGDQATQALDKALDTAPDGVRSSVAYGTLLCAEEYLLQGKNPEAIRAYDRIRAAQVPKQRLLEATRGAILARGSAGVPLLLEQLRSADKGQLAIGLRTARELPGPEATAALVAELDRAAADRQNLMLLALADRDDPAVLPKLLQVAQSGPKAIRSTAVGLMDRFRSLSSVPVLLQAAAEGDAELARPAKAALTRLGGKEVDADLVGRLAQAQGKTRVVLIDLARQRRLAAALPAVAGSMADADAGVRAAAIETVGVLGAEPEAAELARLLPKTQDAQERTGIEKALVGICGRAGARCLPSALALSRDADGGVRSIALHALASIGGAEALGAVKSALADPAEAVQDEAVSTLSNWPSTWPDDAGVAEPLLGLARSAKKPSHQAQALRGYLEYVQEDKKSNTEQKLDKVKAVLPLAQTTEAKRLAVSVLSALPTPAALEPLLPLAEDSAVAEEACLGLVKVAAGQKGASDLRRKALQVALDKSKSDATRKKAQDALQKLQ